MFDSLDQAAEFGVIEPTMVKQIRAGKGVVAIVQFEPSKVVDAYGKGDEAGVARAAALIKQMRTDVLKTVPVKPTQLFELVPAFVTELFNSELALRLINHKHVLSLAPDRPNVLHLDESLPRVRQPQVVTGSGLTGAGTSVVVLDTGADYTDVAFGMCSAPGVPAGCRVPVAFDIAPDDRSLDDHGHGTNVAAIVAGVAPGANVIPIDVYEGRYIWDRHAIAALSWVLGKHYVYNIAAVNMSYGFDQYFNSPCGGAGFLNLYTSPFQMMRQAGVLPVASAGNHAMHNPTFTSGVSVPSCTAGAIAVGAVHTRDETDDQPGENCTDKAPISFDQITCFTAGGPMVDVLAPGTGITAAGITMTGTSQASPHAAGAVALLKQAAPNSSALDREIQLTTSSVQILDPRTGLTRPRLDLPSAVRRAAPVPNDNRSDKTVLIGSSGRFAQTTWTAGSEPGETGHAGDPGGASVWYEWTASQAINAVITTDGSDFDTLLSVYSVDAMGNLAVLGENDDEAMGISTSRVAVGVAAGQRIQIAIDGKLDTTTGFTATGHAKLTWNLPNDDIADAVSFPDTIFANGAARSGSNLRSTHQFGEQAHCGDVYARASVWYKWEPSTDQSVRARLGGVQLTCLAIYSAPRALTQPAFSDLTRIVSGSDDQGDAIDVTFDAVTANTYWMAVDGVSFESACYPNGMCDYITTAGPFSLQLN
ncbi:hypothetical protein Rhe02_20980 [Rhizocola hellebori]|uniref:Peptidase S8/S53 domain-containing protein n=1 Tax=Rhizocola hellebori TaxID=1392758 RepID=A0A8J3VFA1_9ACTN|nr:S8 family serine peptidase [Rhizocola hellebori]GIH04031.1 hypothetical protein Rhe02_20980 [Rhizocola hellebori]